LHWKLSERKVGVFIEGKVGRKKLKLYWKCKVTFILKQNFLAKATLILKRMKYILICSIMNIHTHICVWRVRWCVCYVSIYSFTNNFILPPFLYVNTLLLEANCAYIYRWREKYIIILDWRSASRNVSVSLLFVIFYFYWNKGHYPHKEQVVTVLVLDWNCTDVDSW
jgi:hypothetical protein